MSLLICKFPLYKSAVEYLFLIPVDLFLDFPVLIIDLFLSITPPTFLLFSSILLIIFEISSDICDVSTLLVNCCLMVFSRTFFSLEAFDFFSDSSDAEISSEDFFLGEVLFKKGFFFTICFDC
jgi:hypothetical protein